MTCKQVNSLRALTFRWITPLASILGVSSLDIFTAARILGSYEGVKEHGPFIYRASMAWVMIKNTGSKRFDSANLQSLALSLQQLDCLHNGLHRYIDGR